jgi:tetratricopeptide (TPR) repeat protein
VAETISFKYRAFLSYSHRDTGWAKWLHARLEGFHIDKDLIGRQTPVGPVPKTLRLIFRDREDFSGGHALTEATVTALDASAAFIVLCSTVSAGRPAVNEEVRLFRSRHPDRPVIPVIIDGTWPDNFPSALRYELTADGAITDRPVNILGPDLRESGDGKILGLVKIVAGLTGLAPDDVYRRAERARRKQGRLRAAVAAVIVVLAIVGGGFYWQSHRQKQTLAEIAALVDKYSLVTPAQAAVPGAKQSLTQAITAIAEGAATDPRYAIALALLKAGKPDEAEPLLKAIAEDKEKRADKDAKDAAAAYRNLASIAAVSDPGRARDYYARAARLDPSDVDGMFQNGWSQEEAGQLDAAQAAYVRVISAAKPGTDDEDLVWAKFGMGDIEQQRGDLGAALASYHEAEAIADRLAKSDTGNGGWQRDLSVSYNKAGNVQVAQGNLPVALASYQASLAIADRLAKSYAGNAEWQRDLSVSHNKVGNVQVAQGDLPAALASYQASRAILDRLAKSDPGNAGWQRDLGVSNEKVGNVQVAKGDLPAALASYQTDLAIAERLAESDAGNAVWQRDLAVSYSKLGDVFAKQGNGEEALQNYRLAIAIMERLSAVDATNLQWQADVIEYNYDLAINGDNSANRFAYVVGRLRKLKSERELSAEQVGWLAEAETRLGKMQGGNRDLP